MITRTGLSSFSRCALCLIMLLMMFQMLGFCGVLGAFDGGDWCIFVFGQLGLGLCSMMV